MLEKLKSLILWFRAIFHDEPEGTPTPHEWIRLRKDTIRFAEILGKSDLPAQDSTELTEQETKILRLASKEKEHLTRVMQREAESATNRLASFSPQLLISELNTEARIATTNLQSSLQNYNREASLIKKECISRKKELDAFRDKNKLDRDSKHPDSIIWHISILLSILLIEMLSNSYFFMNANPLGFVGAFIQSLMIAVIGFSLAWVTSTCLRQSNHISLVKKLFYLFATIISIAVLLTFVVLVGHLRDFQHANPTATLTSLNPIFFYEKLLQEPFVFTSVDSYIMTCIVFILNIIAVIDFFKMDDPYPGHGDLSRRFLDSRLELKDFGEIHNDVFKKSRDEAITSMRERNRTVETKLNQQAAVLGLYNIKEQSFLKDLEALTIKTNNLLMDFRKVNESARSSSPPIYFKEHEFSIENPTLTEVKPVLSGESLHDLQGRFANTIEATNSQIESIYLQAQKQLSEAIQV